MAKIILVDSANAQHEIDITVGMLHEAKASGAKHLGEHLNNLVQTRPDQPTAAQQAYARAGFHRNPTMSAIDQAFGVATTSDGSVTGRLLTLPYLMEAQEDKLREGDYGAIGLFNSKAAIVESITGTKFERPILHMSKPESSRSRNIAQLSEPASMLLLTTSDKTYKIANTSIGIEYSDQAFANISLNVLQLSMQRQAETQRLEEIEEQFLDFLNGNEDLDMAPLSAVPGAVKNAKADFDSSLAVGKLSQTAWVGWLFNNSRKRRIDTVITDLAGALAIENRSGRPNVNGDNATSKRIDTLDNVINPTWPDRVDVIISQDPNWPANTVVGFSSTYGYHVVNSLDLNYNAVEEYAIRRSTKLRIDRGSISYRLFDDAWSVLTLTV